MSVRAIRVVSWLVLVGFIGVAASAAPVSTTLTFRVTAVDSGITAVAVGDVITIQYTIDDAVTDTDVAVGAGTFPSLMTAASASAGVGNTGSWTPAGTFNLAGSNYVTNAFGDGFTFQLLGTGFPAGGSGLSFADVDLGFHLPFDLTDSGLGDSFAHQLGDQSIDFPSYLVNASLRFTDGQDYSLATLALTSVGPALSEPVVPALGETGLAALALLLAFAGIVALRGFSSGC